MSVALLTPTLLGGFLSLPCPFVLLGKKYLQTTNRLLRIWSLGPLERHHALMSYRLGSCWCHVCGAGVQRGSWEQRTAAKAREDHGHRRTQLG